MSKKSWDPPSASHSAKMKTGDLGGAFGSVIQQKPSALGGTLAKQDGKAQYAPSEDGGSMKDQVLSKKGKKTLEYDSYERKLNMNEQRYDYEKTHTSTAPTMPPPRSEGTGTLRPGDQQELRDGDIYIGPDGREYRYEALYDTQNGLPGRFLPPGVDQYGNYVPDIDILLPGVRALQGEGYGYGNEDPEAKKAREFLAKEEEVYFAIDRIGPMPLTIGCTRVTLSFVEPNGPHLSEVPGFDPVCVIQDLKSPCMVPAFPKAFAKVKLRPKVMAAVTVEVLDVRSDSIGVLGHLIVPLWSKRGSFECRLKERHWHDFDVAKAPHLPVTSIRYRVNEVSIPNSYFKMFDLTEMELQLLKDRPADAAKKIPLALRIQHPDIDKQFKAQEKEDRAQVDLTTYAPFNDARGVQVVLHGLNNVSITPTTAEGILAAQAGAFLFKVAVTVLDSTQLGQNHNWGADVKYPAFDSEILTFPDLEAEPIMHAVFQIYVMRLSKAIAPGAQEKDVETHKHWAINPFAWGVVRLLDEDGFLTHLAGHRLPLFYGPVPPDVELELKVSPCEEVLESWVRGKRLKPVLSSEARFFVSVGDPARQENLVQAKGEGSSVPTVKTSLQEAFCGSDGAIPVKALHRSAQKAFSSHVLE